MLAAIGDGSHGQAGSNSKVRVGRQYAQNSYSAGRDEDVPRGGRLGSLDAHVEKPAFVSAAITSSGARDVKMSFGIPMRSIRSFGRKRRPHGRRRKHAMDFSEARVERAPEVDRVDGAHFPEPMTPRKGVPPRYPREKSHDQPTRLQKTLPSLA